MDLWAPQHGYAYQDLLTVVRLVDVLLGAAATVLVDTKVRQVGAGGGVPAVLPTGEL